MIQNLSQQVQDLISGIGMTSSCQMDPKLIHGVQAPILSTVDKPGPAPTINEHVVLEVEGISKLIMSALEEEVYL